MVIIHCANVGLNVCSENVHIYFIYLLGNYLVYTRWVKLLDSILYLYVCIMYIVATTHLKIDIECFKFVY